MTVLLVNGSPHPQGNTATALQIIQEELMARGLDISRFELGTKPIRGCINCRSCRNTHRCAFGDDGCNELIEKMLAADGVVIGSPVYFAGPNGALCALLDRCFYASANYGGLLKGKLGAALVTVWREGGTAALDRLNKYFQFAQMPVVSSHYWNAMLNGEDSYGKEILQTLGKNIAELLLLREEKKGREK